MKKIVLVNEDQSGRGGACIQMEQPTAKISSNDMTDSRKESLGGKNSQVAFVLRFSVNLHSSLRG